MKLISFQFFKTNYLASHLFLKVVQVCSCIHRKMHTETPSNLHVERKTCLMTALMNCKTVGVHFLFFSTIFLSEGECRAKQRAFGANLGGSYPGKRKIGGSVLGKRNKLF